MVAIQMTAGKASIKYHPHYFYSFSPPCTGVVALNSLLYVVGGDDGTSNLASVEVYNPKTDVWTLLPAHMGIGRSYAGVAIIDKPGF